MEHIRNEWLVFFYTPFNPPWYTKWRKKGFTHVGAMNFYPKFDCWMLLEGLYGRLHVELIDGPEDQKILSYVKRLNGKDHFLISSVCISKNGSMVWNYTDKAILTMKKMSEDYLKDYLSKISDEDLYAYNVYQIEGEGRKLFSKIEGDEDTIMGLPIKKIKEYLSTIK